MATRVLILSVTAGAGHLRAAQAVEAAFLERHPEVDLHCEDALDYTNAAFRNGYSQGYERLVKELPSVWGHIYERLEAKPARSRLKSAMALFDRLNAARLTRMVAKLNPDCIVCTHFVPVEVLAQRRRKGKLRAPLYVVLTDYDVHTMWIQEGVDGYFVATEEMAYALRARGTDAHITVTGIPVLPAFARTYPSRPDMRRQLGLDPSRPAVLVSAGGFGMMRADEAAVVLAGRLPQVQLLVVAGRNEALRERLERVASKAPGHIIPFGFVDNMHELMAASDLAVAKSGGLTTSECLALGLPMVVFNPIPGQEERNALYLLENGAGLWAHTAANMLYKAETLLADPERLARMQANARRIGRPDAAFRIAHTVLGSTGAKRGH